MQVINQVGMKVEYLIFETAQTCHSKDEVIKVHNSLQTLLNNNNLQLSNIFKVTVYYNPSSCNSDVNKLKSGILPFFKDTVPAISFIAQPPIGDFNLIIEMNYLVDGLAKIDFKKDSEISYTLVNVDGYEQIFISGLTGDSKTQGILNYAESAFQKLEYILDKEGFAFTDIVRQWNYIEGIVAEENNDQHYQVFNDVRTKFYDKNGLVSNYPAATGIGIKEGGVIIEVHAIKKNPDLKIVEIANPLQTDAFDYSENVLRGKPIEGCVCKTTPKFSRAKMILKPDSAGIFISGTASIIGEKTYGIGNVAEQTQVTIENMQRLITSETLKKHGVNYEYAADNFDYVRVYLKNRSDFDQIRPICEKNFKYPNIIYVEADICRDNLLVEIEGVLNFDVLSD